MTLIIRNDLFAFAVGFVLAWWILSTRQSRPRPDNAKPQTPDADFEAFDKRSPILPQKEQKVS